MTTDKAAELRLAVLRLINSLDPKQWYSPETRAAIADCRRLIDETATPGLRLLREQH